MDSLAPFIVLLVVIVVTAAALVVAFARKGSVARLTMTKRRIVLLSTAPPEVMFDWLSRYCPPGYSVDDADPARRTVILSSRPTAFTWGFFYPAVVTPEGIGSRVDLGIKSKMFQYGPLVTRAHRKLAHTLAGLTQSQIIGS